MKKIININLSGRVIPIEDSAYESLQRYIESLRHYFRNEDGRDEIINDIESRIAELMNDKVRKGAAAVTDADIEEIIAAMGRVEDFAEAEAESSTTNTSTNSGNTSGTYTQTSAKPFRGRLYRDNSDKLLGGICSGIASYTNIDPAIVRLLFAIITFGGFGTGIIIYILLWIILPARNLNTYVGKRLFRNPDDRIIGGVGGGLGAYFNKHPWIIRLIFAAPLLLNILISLINHFPFRFGDSPFPDLVFGSFTGTFIIAYIILWILLPEARSPFEKMEMRGETVDVNSIRQNVKDEMNQFKSRAQSWGEEVKTATQNFGNRAAQFAGTRSRSFAAEVAQTARPVARGIGHAIGVLFKAFFLFITGTLSFALFVLVLVFILGGVSQAIQDFILNGFWQHAFMWGTLILFLAVPLISFITWVVRRLLKVRSQNRYLGWAFGGLWTLGWVSLVFFVSSLVNDFRYYNKTPQDIAVTQPATNKMIVRIDDPEIRFSGNYYWVNSDGRGWDITGDSLKLSNVQFRVDKSEDSAYHVTVWKYSAGHNRAEALQRAQKINYTATSLDSNLIIGSGFGVYKAQKFRNQKVIIAIKIPVGKKIRFDESVNKLDHVNMHLRFKDRWNGKDWDDDWNDDVYYSDWPAGVDYIMMPSGELKEADKVTNTKGVYEYHSDNNADSLQQEIDKKEKQLEKDREQLEKAQEQQQQVSLQPTVPQSSKKATRISLSESDEESMVQKVNHFVPLII